MSANKMTKGVKKYASKGKYTPKTTYKKSRNPAFRDKNKVAKPERKICDVASTLTPPIGSAFVTTPLQLNPTTGGTGTNLARIGTKCEFVQLHLRANALWAGGQTTNAPQQIRYVVVYDKQSNGAAPSRSDLFQDGTVWQSPINIAFQDRFIVLADVLSDQIESNGQFCVGTEIFRKMALEAVWPLGGTAYPNTGGISLWVAANSDWSDATSAHFPTIQIYSRMKYTDC